jgi:hypothetical protein
MRLRRFCRLWSGPSAKVIRRAIAVERLVPRLNEGLDAKEVKVTSFEGRITDQKVSAILANGERTPS